MSSRSHEGGFGGGGNGRYGGGGGYTGGNGGGAYPYNSCGGGGGSFTQHGIGIEKGHKDHGLLKIKMIEKIN